MGGSSDASSSLGQIVLSDVALLLPPLELEIYRTLLGNSPDDFSLVEAYLSPAAVQYLWELLNSHQVRSFAESPDCRKRGRKGEELLIPKA